MKSIINYFREVRVEISKVEWPKRVEVIKLTLIVFIFSGIIGAYLGLLDFTFTSLLNKLITK